MTMTIAIPEKQTRTTESLRQPKPLTLREFRRKYSDIEDGWKYEFNRGEIEKSPSAMKMKQYHIVKNLTRRFAQTGAYAAGDELGSEVELLTSGEQLRRPDLAWLSSHKIKSRDETISPFVIEIISPTDPYIQTNSKLREYFNAGVQVVWQIIPETQTVYVYTSPTQAVICEGDTICSAAPVVPDFQMAAKDIFVK